MTSWSDLTPAAKAAVKLACERDHLYFTRFFFKERLGMPFKVGPHHKLIGQALDRVIAGEIDRLLISVPPGHTKTEEAVIAFIARGMAITGGRAKFIHASFSGELVNENSMAIKETMGTEPYREMWPIDLRADASGKGRWITDAGGGLLAKPAGGPITGFRAGLMEPGFTGALVIDDPLKPDDAFSPLERSKINRRWHSTFKSRLAQEKVPVIVIMQRLHDEDFAGFLLRGNAHCEWHHLMLPVLIEAGAEYPSEYTHGIPIEHDLPLGPLWTEKHTAAQIETLKADAFTFASQYMQRPIALGGNVFKEAWLTSYAELPNLRWRAIYADTAQKVGEKNDYSVLAHWGLGTDGKAYLLDQVRAKLEAPELLSTAQLMWDRAKALPHVSHGIPRYMAIEDKVSGTGLMQQLARLNIPTKPIKRGNGRDKYQRAQDAIPFFANGLIRIPADAPWIKDWTREVLTFTGQGDAHDDQVDVTVDAVCDLLAGANNYEAWT